MAEASIEAKANAKFVDEEFDEAIKLYSEAIDANPGSSQLYSSRAAAFLKTQNYLGNVELKNLKPFSAI